MNATIATATLDSCKEGDITTSVAIVILWGEVGNFEDVKRLLKARGINATDAEIMQLKP